VDGNPAWFGVLTSLVTAMIVHGGIWAMVSLSLRVNKIALGFC
jgi:hypothetical protein